MIYLVIPLPWGNSSLVVCMKEVLSVCPDYKSRCVSGCRHTHSLHYSLYVNTCPSSTLSVKPLEITDDTRLASVAGASAGCHQACARNKLEINVSKTIARRVSHFHRHPLTHPSWISEAAGWLSDCETGGLVFLPGPLTSQVDGGRRGRQLINKMSELSAADSLKYHYRAKIRDYKKTSLSSTKKKR